MKKKISFVSLVLLIIGSIDNIRNLPSSALFGSSSIFFFLLAAIFFLIPTALVAAELTATFPNAGGVYHWVKAALGKKMGFLAVWLQWSNTVFWYPTILSFLAGSIAYLYSPSLAASPIYILSVILVLFWILTGINLLGVHASTKVNNLCGLFGTMFPMVVLIGMGIYWAASGHPIQIGFSSSELLPSIDKSATWVSLISIMASFLGMELCAVHVTEIDSPQKNYPKAVFLAAIFILGSMLLGTLAIAAVLPTKEISLVSGVLQVFSNLFAAFGIPGLVPLMALLMIMGSFGNMINWINSPTTGLLHASHDGFLPKAFIKKNRHGAPSHILITQAVIVSLLSTLYLLVPSINSFYWFLTALTTGLYMLMYILLFIGALVLHHKHRDRGAYYKIPFGDVGMWITCCLGLVGCIMTLIIGFFPPDSLHIVSKLDYAFWIGAGFLGAILPVFALFYFQKGKNKVYK